jgi:hypothetical protein
MTTITRALSVALLSMTIVGTGLIGSAVADTPWQKAHPRREQVNNRLAHQNYRIHREVREGELTRPQAAGLHQEDRQIRQEERNMASRDGSHITRPEQRTLNQQENAVSRQIGR